MQADAVRNAEMSKRVETGLAARFHRDDAGSVMLEHALLLAAFTIPMYVVLMAMIRALGTYYGMLTFFASTPFF